MKKPSLNLKLFSAESFAVLFLLLLLTSCSNQRTDQSTNNDQNSTSFTQKHLETLLGADGWMAPDTSTIPHNADGELIRYGRNLITNTAYYLGPEGKIKHQSNGMSCQNCHLDAGTKLYGNSFSAVYANYPKFRARSGTVEHLEHRISDCMERSLNGKKLDSLSREMRAMVAYINWVGKEVKKDSTPKGAAVVDLPYLDRAADPALGKVAFQKNCISCHGANGQGKFNPDSGAYEYPPLWGEHSYNTAAGLFRLSRLAGFIKSNMPNLKSSHEKPLLTDEEAWDIAAYISSMPRPIKTFKQDWPDISKKPVDHPFGPYADNFSETQHKYGPYTAIVKSRKK